MGSVAGEGLPLRPVIIAEICYESVCDQWWGSSVSGAYRGGFWKVPVVGAPHGGFSSMRSALLLGEETEVSCEGPAVGETKRALLIGASNPSIKKMNWTGKLIKWDRGEPQFSGT
jgi:hypothetical protein